MPEPISNPISNSISDVERETGLAKETLRVWERRYGFPQPGRDAFGERVYPPEQVGKLRLIKRLIDSGHRPGKIIQHSITALQELAGDHSVSAADEPAGAEVRADLKDYLELCKTHQVEELRRRLSQAMLQIGLQRFVLEVVAPLNVLVGEYWASGQFAIFEEHLYTESLQVVMRNAISGIRHDSTVKDQPHVLLTTFPQERHGLGLLMAESLFALHGGRCVSLGVQTPIAEIVDAADAQQADIIALSFSSAMNPRQTIDGLVELRRRLPPAVEVWAGGCCAVLAKRPPSGIKVLQLDEIAATLAYWRQSREQTVA